MLSPPPVPISQNGALQAVLQLLYQKLGAKRTSPNPAGPAPPATIRAAAAMHPGPVDESVSRLSPPAPQRARSPWLHRHTLRAVDQDGEVVDVFLQTLRDAKAAKRFFKRLINRHRREPRKIVTDKSRSYGVAHRELLPKAIHDSSRYANNRAELSHQPTRSRERGMRRSKSA